MLPTETLHGSRSGPGDNKLQQYMVIPFALKRSINRGGKQKVEKIYVGDLNVPGKLNTWWRKLEKQKGSSFGKKT